MLEKALTRFPMYVHLWRAKLHAYIVDGRYAEAEAMLSPGVARPDAWTESQVAPSLALVKVLRSHDPAATERFVRELHDKAIADATFAGEAPWQLVILGRYEDAYELLQENYPRTYSGGGRSLPDEEAVRRNWVGYGEITELYGDFALRAFRRDRRFLLVYDDGNALDYWRAIGKWPDFCADPTLRYDCKVETEKRIAARSASRQGSTPLR